MSITFKSSGGGGGNNGYDPSGVTATAADVLQGKTFMAKDGSMQAGSIPIKAAATITPTTTAQSIEAGQYLAGEQTISAIKTQTKSVSVSAGSSTTVTPSSGYYLTRVTVSSPAVSVTPVIGTFTPTNRDTVVSIYCGITDPKLLFVIAAEDVTVSSTSYDYVIALSASGSGLSSNKQIVSRLDEENYANDGGFTITTGGGYIDIEVNDSGYCFRGCTYKYYVI